MRTKINKKSDFDFIVLDGEGNPIPFPTDDFSLFVWTWGSKCRFKASSIKGVLTGCKNEDNKLRVFVDNPGFVPGKLVGELVTYVTNDTYDDGSQRTCRYISDFGIDMVNEDSETNEVQVLAMMQYIQGASAYEIACEYGYQGTEEEWLATLSLDSRTAANECRELMAEFSADENVREANEATRLANEAGRIAAENKRVEEFAEMKSTKVTPEMLSESTKQYINASGGGTITNLADDEDLTSVDNVLKLANKDYSPTSYSGMGRVYLRKNMVDGKNILTQEMMTKENTIYIIQYDYDLNGTTINVPANCTLDFQGGSLRNGTIGFDNTFVTGKPKILTDIKANSTLENTILNIDWFGAVKDDSSVDNSLIIKKLGNISNRNNILIPEGTYYAKSFSIPGFKHLNGCGRGSVIKAMSNGNSYSYKNVQIDEIFIAIQNPQCVIQNLIIDGGYTEGYRNVCIGIYQEAATTKILHCRFKNAIGCIWQRMYGGNMTYAYNNFNTGIEFCLRLDYVSDKVEVISNNFEGFNIVTDDAVIKVNPDSDPEGICKSLLISENRFESIKAKYIYDFVNAGFFTNVTHNMYLLGGLDADTIMYRVRKQGSAIRFRDEFFQNTGELKRFYIIDNNSYNHNVIIDNAVPALRNDYIGYFDEDGIYQTWNRRGDLAKIHLIVKGYDYWMPQTSSVDQACKLASNAIIGQILQISYNGAFSILRPTSNAQSLVLKSDKIYIAKNPDENTLNLVPISWLHNPLGGITSNRPTENLKTWNSYFDTTLGRPIWWDGGAWVDPMKSTQMIKAGLTEQRPTATAQSGQQYFDTTLGKPIWWNGSAWVDSTGAVV